MTENASTVQGRAVAAAPERAATRQGKRGHPWLTLVAVSLGIMMVGLDGTVVSVANPTIERDLHASLAGLQWVTNGYLLALAVLMILGGKLGDRFGRRLMFTIGIVGFALGSLGCALSSSIEMLVLFRVIQGFAGALLMPNTLAILRATFPPSDLVKAVGVWGATTALAVASGPIIGGLLVEHVSWQSIFLLNLPLGALALAVTLVVVAETRDLRHSKSFDFVGVVLLTAGLFVLIWALIKAEGHGWASLYVGGFGTAGLVGLVAFGLWEARVTAPLLPLRVFRSRSVWAGTLLVMIGFMGLFGVLFFLTLYFQNVHGYSPVQTGVRMLPLTGMFIVSPIVGSIITQRFGPRLAVVIGMLVVGIAMLGLTGLGTESAYGSVWPWFALLGIGLGFIMTSTTEAIVGNVPVELGGVAGGLQSTANQLGGVLGTAILGSVLVSSVGGTLGGALANVGVHGQTAAAVIAQKEAVGSGIAPVTPSMSHQLATAITTASHNAFMHGLHTSMIVAAILAFLGAALGLLIQRGGTDDEDEDTGATVAVRSERVATAGVSPEPAA
jgi:EmrB/QacA subfamily drug resistance transporter